MSAQKTLSQLSFAIIALVLAAIPCFAQTESATEQLSASNLTANEVATVSNVRRIGAHRSELFAVRETEASAKLPPFSATKFMQGLRNTTSLETKSNSQTPTIALNFDTTRFEGDKPSSPKRITFVPSKGHQQIPQ